MRGSERVNENQRLGMGFCGGFFFQFNFKKIFSIRTNLAGEIKGNTSSFVLTDASGKPITTYSSRANLAYITLPLLIRATFGEKCRFFLNAGPYIGYLLKQPSEAALNITFRNTPIKKFDMGITTGLGFSIPINAKAAFSMEIRHNLGLYNISNTVPGYSETIKTNSANLLLSYTRKLGFRNQ